MIVLCCVVLSVCVCVSRGQPELVYSDPVVDALMRKQVKKNVAASAI